MSSISRWSSRRKKTIRPPLRDDDGPSQQLDDDNDKDDNDQKSDDDPKAVTSRVFFGEIIFHSNLRESFSADGTPRPLTHLVYIQVIFGGFRSIHLENWIFG